MKLLKRGTVELKKRLLLLLFPLIGFVITWGIQYIAPMLEGMFQNGEVLDVLEGENIYSTLIDLILAIDALAVTVFIFLATAPMERYADYEQDTIRKMVGNRTKLLSWLSILSSGCIVGCLCINLLGYSEILFKATVFVISIVDICLLLVYAVSGIRYKREIVDTARFYRRRLENEMLCRNPNMKGEEFSLQLIGDIAMVIERIVDNHTKEGHNNDMRILRKVIGNGLEGDTLADDYLLLISYRDFLRVEYSDSEETVACAPQFMDIISRMRGRLKTELMMGESMSGMSFLGEKFYEHKWPFNLNRAILSDSSFLQINMNGANLSGADMSRVRLTGVQLEDSDCTETVFLDSVWKDVKLSPWTRFDRADFRNVDFSEQIICGGAREGKFSLLNMPYAYFARANMFHCNLNYVDLSSCGMNDVLLSGALINTVALSFTNLSGAIMTDVVFRHDEIYPDAFPLEVFAKKHMRNGNVLPGFELEINVAGERKHLCPAFYANLEGATLTDSYISQYNWNGSRIADSIFTHAIINACIFDSCYGKNVTFRDAEIFHSKFNYAMLNMSDLSYTEIVDCDFTDANLQGCLFIHKTDVGKAGHIINCTFDRSNFSKSQFRGCVFVNCSFKNANFAGTTLMNVEFKNCTFLKTAHFEGSYLIDVRGIPTA